MSIREQDLNKGMSYQEEVVANNSLDITQLKKGEEGVILSTPSNALLAPLGIRKGKRFKLKSKQIFGGPIVVSVEDRNIAIDRKMASQIKLSRGIDKNEGK